MTSAAPAHRAAPHMTHTPDPTATPQSQAIDGTVADRPARPTLRDQIAENPLLSLFLGLTLAVLTFVGTLAVALLVFTLNDINDGLDSLGERIDRVEVSLGERIDRVEVSLGERIDRVEVSLGERIDRVEVSLGERIDRVEAKVDTGFAAPGSPYG